MDVQQPTQTDAYSSYQAEPAASYSMSAPDAHSSAGQAGGHVETVRPFNPDEIYSSNAPRRDERNYGDGNGDKSGQSDVPGERSRPSRPGDWVCSCGADNFARRNECFQCKAPKPGADSSYSSSSGQQFNNSGRPATSRPGDWSCSGCGNLNFSYRTECRRCNAPKDRNAGGGSRSYGDGGRGPMGGSNTARRDGDWDCSQCGNMNFGFRETCRRCDASRVSPGGGRGYGGYGGYSGSSRGGMYPPQSQYMAPPPASGGYPPYGQPAAQQPAPSYGNYGGYSQPGYYAQPAPQDPYGAPPVYGAPMQPAPMQAPVQQPMAYTGYDGSMQQPTYAAPSMGQPAGVMPGAQPQYAAPSAAGAYAPYGTPSGGLPMQQPHASYGMSASGGGAQAPGDWTCVGCGNHNFARRDVCHRCTRYTKTGEPVAPRY